ncbi:hypothetical protein BH24ACI4_BH24ACI4_33680 [soil metagenome]
MNGIAPMHEKGAAPFLILSRTGDSGNGEERSAHSSLSHESSVARRIRTARADVDSFRPTTTEFANLFESR